MTCRASVTALWLLFFPLTARAAGVDLRPKFQKDQQVYYVATVNMDIKQTASPPGGPPQEAKSQMNSQAGMRFEVREVREDGATELEWTILFFTMSATGPQPFGYDSREEASQTSPRAMLFQPMIDKPTLLVVDAKGEVIDYRGMDPAAMGPAGQAVSQFFSKGAFQQIGLFPTVEAPNPAEPGAQWKRQLKVELPVGTMVHDAEYKLISVDEAAKKARIEAKGRSSMQPASASSRPAGLPPFTIEKGESGGFIMWDLALGQMESTETQADMAMTLGEGKAHMTQKVQSTIKRTTKAELKLPEDKPAATQPAP